MLPTTAILLRNVFSKPMTVKFPWESIELPEGYRGEHSYDIDLCTSCGLCGKICPNKAIEMVKVPAKYEENYPKQYPKIDLAKCCFCALCQDICSKGAIKLTQNVFLATPDPSLLIRNPIAEEDPK